MSYSTQTSELPGGTNPTQSLKGVAQDARNTQTQLTGTLKLAQTSHKAYTTLAGPRGMLEKVDAPDGVLARSVLAGTCDWASKDEE